jgi:hypothetical protein
MKANDYAVQMSKLVAQLDRGIITREEYVQKSVELTNSVELV